MNFCRKTCLLATLTLIVGCNEPPPPRSVDEFMNNPILLEAAVVRCAQNRTESRYDAECINAREAIKLIEVKEEAKRRAELEARSKRKRDALRRTQRAAAEARRRATEAQRQREEAEYLGQFGDAESAGDGETASTFGNEPMVVIPEEAAVPDDGYERSPVYSEPPPSEGSNVPVVDTNPADEVVTEEELAQDPPRDLTSIRDELKRRNEDASE